VAPLTSSAAALWHNPPLGFHYKFDRGRRVAMAKYADVVAQPSWKWKSSAPNADLRAVLSKGYPNIGVPICARCTVEGIDFPQAMFLFAQAFTEQSVTVGNPAPFGYRIFNMMLHDDEKAQFSAEDWERMLKAPVPVPGVPGTSVRRIPSDEIINGQRVSRTSPFFAFDSMPSSVRHFLRRLSGDAQYFSAATAAIMALRTGYATAFKVLQDKKSGVDDYTRALQAGGYATAGPTYITDIHKRYRTVCADFIEMVKACQTAGGPDDTGDVLATMKAQAEAALKATPQLS
jgi:hypothetical protein